jgi:hypothetical protein
MNPNMIEQMKEKSKEVSMMKENIGFTIKRIYA